MGIELRQFSQSRIFPAVFSFMRIACQDDFLYSCYSTLLRPFRDRGMSGAKEVSQMFV
jgi:hypothetical protein